MASSTPIVFLHAFPLNPGMWTPQVHALGHRRAFAPAFPGFGDRAPGLPSLEAFARAVLEDLDASGVSRAIFVGLSMGGYVAFRLLDLAPERFLGLVLADTRPGPDAEEAKAKRTDQAARVRREDIGWLREALIPALLGRTTLEGRPDVVEEVSGLMAAGRAEGVARALEAMRDRPDSTSLLPGIQVPTLVICGEEDTLTPVEEARGMAESIPQGRLVVIESAGHLSNLEAPDAFNDALANYLDWVGDG